MNDETRTGPLAGAAAAAKRWLVAVLPILGLMTLPVSATGQLRPTGPVEWDIFENVRPWAFGLGVGLIEGQRASLAGTTGDLLEGGNFRIAYRSGRIGLEFTGTLARRFRDEAILRSPAPGTDGPTGKIRHDAGDVLATTLIRLNGADSPFLVALRFGTRLPTTSNEPGLDRDRTDFFTTLAARYRVGRFAVSAETGLGILSTRVDGIDQLDVQNFSAGVESRVGPVIATASIVGQDDWHRRVVRGNEDLSELRFGLRAGDRQWVSVTAVKGIAQFSPGYGVLVMLGVRR
jgi:hypothetical protein